MPEREMFIGGSIESTSHLKSADGLMMEEQLKSVDKLSNDESQTKKKRQHSNEEVTNDWQHWPVNECISYICGQEKFQLKNVLKSYEAEIQCNKKQIEILNYWVKEHYAIERGLEIELEACRLAQSLEIPSHKKIVKNLLAVKEKNEVQYLKRIKQLKREIKCFDNRLTKEVNVVHSKYGKEVQDYRIKFERQLEKIDYYQNCMNRLRIKVKLARQEYASLESRCGKQINELLKEVQLLKEENNNINIKVMEAEKNESNVTEKLEEYSVEIESLKVKCHSLNLTLKEKESEEKSFMTKLNQLQCKVKEREITITSLLTDLEKARNDLQEKESEQESIMLELHKYQEIIDEYDTKLKECDKQFQESMMTFQAKHEQDVGVFQNQIDRLLFTLTEVNSKHEQDMNEWTEEIKKQQKTIASFKMAANCNSVEEVFVKLKVLENCNLEIESLKEKLTFSTNVACDYENRLTELSKCYEYDSLLYKNQIDKLQEELNNTSALEANLRQLTYNIADMNLSKDQLKKLLSRNYIQGNFVENLASCNNLSENSSGETVANNVKMRHKEPNDGQGEVSEELEIYAGLDVLNQGNYTIGQDLDNLKKPKCNVSIHPRVNEEQKQHIEQALFDELEKELHDCKIDNMTKVQDITELIKANNELADHYSSLEYQLGEKVTENTILRSQYDNLRAEKVQLESDQIMLLEKIKSITKLKNPKIDEINKIEKLTLKEMECCSETIKTEMAKFEDSCNMLQKRIADLESRKKVVRDLEQIIEQLKLRIKKLEEDKLVLRGDITNLKEENIKLQKKYDENLSKVLTQNIPDETENNVFENIILELNKKSEEVLTLKRKMNSREESITSLKDNLDELFEVKMDMRKRLDAVITDLKVAEEEVLYLKQGSQKLELEKHSAENELNIVKTQNERMLHFTKELEKKVGELNENLSAERAVIEQMTVETIDSKNSIVTEGSETSYKIELLLSAFETLKCEKDSLKTRTAELQEIINKYVDGNGVDDKWKLEVKESQQRLLLELEEYGKQRDVLGKSLIETEDLRAKVENTEKELYLKTQEKSNLEEMLDTEKQQLRSALNRINCLELQLADKDTLSPN